MTFPFSPRRERLRELVSRRQLDALLVLSEHNVYWLTGFTGDSTWLLLTPDSATLLSDSRFETQISEECAGIDAYIRPQSSSLIDAVAEIARQQNVTRIGFEGHIATVEIYDRLSKSLSGCQLSGISQLVESQRCIKDEAEIEEIRLAIQQAEQAMLNWQNGSLSSELTEREAAADLEQILRSEGAQGFSFPGIIAVGDRAALPHYRPGNVALGSSPILLTDWGARTAAGYISDLTRTWLTGEPDGKFETVYKTVLEAQLAAIDLIRPGVRCSEVDAAARSIIQRAGFGEFFGHGLGHGIGLEVHEQPGLRTSSETEIRKGMVVTVEPGIYLPGWGGVRIEDDILVTDDGCEVLSSLPKDWESIRIA